MAKVLNPLMSGQASGTVSGLTFGNGKFGFTCKNKARPVERHRGAQPNIRSLIGYLARYFSSKTTPAEKELWREYAVAHPRVDQFGLPYVLSPNQIFTSINHLAMYVFETASIQTTPPVVPLVVGLETLVAANGVADGEIKLTWTFYGVGSLDDLVQVQMSDQSTSESQSMEIQKFVNKKSVAGNLLTVTVSGLINNWWYRFRVRYIDQYGQTSSWLYTQWKAPNIE